MTAGEARQRQLSRLAQRVSVGEVVFFIGAGFSLDAEKNSAYALIVRLLLRFEAMSEALVHCASARPEQRTHARKLQRSLRETFDLGKLPPQADAVNELFDAAIVRHLDKLSDKYFLINDWLCTAFDEHLRMLDGHLPGALEADVLALEGSLLQRLRAALPDPLPWWADTDLRPGALDLGRLLRFWQHCNTVVLARTERALGGKAMFLDAMGFNEQRVMAGTPMAQDMQAVQAGLQGRLSLRHHALAWLAAEGLCPVVVTTNFDLLLDSAYRLAGLLPWNAPRESWPDEKREQLDDGLEVKVPKNRRYSHFARISDAWQFFRHGQSGRAVHLYKIHGCADAYRIAQARPTELRDLLPTIVFTFREIQNWREDAWSRDMLNTLLRTRTVAFAGYSGADPVIHDTFRTIYEEMAGYQSAARQSEALSNSVEARKRLRGGGALASASNVVGQSAPRGEAAPAFILAPPKRDFHGQEILRAASRAAGEPEPEIAEHPNLLTFHYGPDAAVPTLDETFALIYHDCIRRLQRQALGSQLVQAYYRLSGQRSPTAEAQAIEREFEGLVQHEQAEIASVLGDATADPALRHRLQRVTGWTLHFHRQLMREFALAENFLRHPAEALTVERVTRLPWYCPASEHADWAAWGVVIELALRRGHASLAQGGAVPQGWPAAGGICAAEHNGPALALAQQGVQQALMIELMPMRRVFMRELPRFLKALPPLAWELNNETLPWWREGDVRRPDTTPSATTLWAWAARPAGAWGTEAPAKYLSTEGRSA